MNNVDRIKADNPCKMCEHWKFHSRKDDPEPMHSISFHYCEMQSYKSKQKRLAICKKLGYYKRKGE